jgi:hypothetical protein
VSLWRSRGFPAHLANLTLKAPSGKQYEVENTIGKTSQDMNANELIWSFVAHAAAAGAEPGPEVESGLHRSGYLEAAA